MRVRCRNKNHHTYQFYGAKGITVCDRWDSFQLFMEDMGPAPSNSHSIDRIDLGGNYEPGNCRWATRETQMKNRTNAHLVEFRGRVMNLVDWSIELSIDYDTLRGRLKRGWDIARALDPTPARPGPKPGVKKR
jgi:hypothetical protein